MIKTKSACFSGHRASKLPFGEKSIEYEKLENRLKQQIIDLVRDGYTDFYTGGQNGIDELASLLVLKVKEELQTTIYLHVIIPYRGIQKNFTGIQKENFDYIIEKADEVVYLNETYTKDCFRQRNQYMVDKSDLLIAVYNGNKRSGTGMTVGIAERGEVEVRYLTINKTPQRNIP